MSLEQTIKTYQNLNKKIQELHLLLAKKLLYVYAIDETFLEEEKPSFFELLNKVSSEYIDHTYTIETINKANINTIQIFNNEEEIKNFVKNHPLSVSNLALINKFIYCREYLIYQLKYMGVDEYSVNKALTIKDLILLLDRIPINNREYILSDLTLSANYDIEYNVIQSYEISNNDLISNIELNENGDIVITPVTIINKKDTKLDNVVISLSLDANGNLVVN